MYAQVKKKCNLDIIKNAEKIFMQKNGMAYNKSHYMLIIAYRSSYPINYCVVCHISVHIVKICPE